MSNRPVPVHEHIKKLNPTAATLLGFLHRGPMTGWDLAQMAEMVIGDFWNVTRSQVYRELRTLEGFELVAASAAGPREKRPYAITDAGRTAFQVFINREPGPDLLRSPLLLMVFFGRHVDPARRQRFLAIHRLRHEQALDEYRRIQGRLESGETELADVLEYAIFHEEAVLRWFEWMERRSPAWHERGGGEETGHDSPRR